MRICDNQIINDKKIDVKFYDNVNLSIKIVGSRSHIVFDKIAIYPFTIINAWSSGNEQLLLSSLHDEE